jgi:hypothetical protein
VVIHEKFNFFRTKRKPTYSGVCFDRINKTG